MSTENDTDAAGYRFRSEQHFLFSLMVLMASALNMNKGKIQNVRSSKAL